MSGKDLVSITVDVESGGTEANDIEMQMAQKLQQEREERERRLVDNRRVDVIIDIENARVVNLGQSIETQLNIDIQNKNIGIIVHSINLQLPFLPPSSPLTISVHGIQGQVTSHVITPPILQNVSYPRSRHTLFSQSLSEFGKVTHYRDFGHLTPETINEEIDFLYTRNESTMNDSDLVRIKSDSMLRKVLYDNAQRFPSFQEVTDPQTGVVGAMITYKDWLVFKEGVSVHDLSTLCLCGYAHTKCVFIENQWTY